MELVEKRIIVNPYVGPFPFKAGDENRFFGRSKETEQLLFMIQDKQLTVLFGSSGTGKTSLIHAKLLPELERLYYQPIYIRINFASEDPLEATRKCIIKSLRSWEPDLPDFKTGQTLIEYAAGVNVFKGLVKPVLFFDQFEELFTIGYQNNRNKIDAFIMQLGDLIEMRLPDKLRSTNSLDNLVKFKVVLSLRQDWIAYLEDYKVCIPSLLLQNRFRLKRFLPKQAMDAIRLSANTEHLTVVSESTARKIVRKIGRPSLMWDDYDPDPEIKNISIDPIVLSIYCYQLFELVKDKPRPVIDEQLVEACSDSSLIRYYYDEHMIPFEDAKVLIEDKLLNDAGIRMTIPLKNLLAGSDITAKQIRNVAAKTGLIRLIGSADSPAVEIIHDQVAVQMYESRKERQATENEKKLNSEAILKNEEAELQRKKAIKLRRYSLLAAVTGAAMVIAALIGTYIYIKNNTVVENLQATISSKNTELNLKDDSLTSFNEQMEKMKSTNQDLVSINTYNRQQIISFTQENKRLRKDSLGLTGSNNNLRQQIISHIQEINRIRADSMNLSTSNYTYRQQIAYLTQENSKLKADSLSLSSSNYNYRQQITTLTQENNRLKKDSDADNQQINSLTREVRELKRKLDSVMKSHYTPANIGDSSKRGN